MQWLGSWGGVKGLVVRTALTQKNNKLRADYSELFARVMSTDGCSKLWLSSKDLDLIGLHCWSCTEDEVFQFRHLSSRHPYQQLYFSFVGTYCVIPPVLAQWRTAIPPTRCFSHSSYVLLLTKVHPLLCRTVTKSVNPPWSRVWGTKRKNGIRLWGRIWALSMEFRPSPPKQTLVTYLRWIKRIYINRICLTTIQLLFYTMSNHLIKHWDLSTGDEVVMVWVWSLVDR